MGPPSLANDSDAGLPAGSWQQQMNSETESPAFGTVPRDLSQVCVLLDPPEEEVGDTNGEGVTPEFPTLTPELPTNSRHQDSEYDEAEFRPSQAGSPEMQRAAPLKTFDSLIDESEPHKVSWAYRHAVLSEWM